MSTERLDDLVTRVLAPNPSPMTLEGTNTYLLGSPGSGEVVVVDPGPRILAHRAAVDQAVAACDAEVAAVLITHHHSDHAEAAGWAAEWGAGLSAFTPGLIPHAEAAPLRDGSVLRRAGIEVEAVHTPGHASDHLCLRIRESGAVLTGDHVLGRGTTVVFWPDGDMGAYMESLRRLGELDAPVLYPGHGPVVHTPRAVVAEYVEHRLERERQVVSALEAGDETPGEIVARVYADVDPVLHQAAERSVRAHLEKLAGEARAQRRAGPDGVPRFRVQA